VPLVGDSQFKDCAADHVLANGIFEITNPGRPNAETVAMMDGITSFFVSGDDVNAYVGRRTTESRTPTN